jgi:hypothetical protein
VRESHPKFQIYRPCSGKPSEVILSEFGNCLKKSVGLQENELVETLGMSWMKIWTDDSVLGLADGRHVWNLIKFTTSNFSWYPGDFPSLTSSPRIRRPL